MFARYLVGDLNNFYGIKVSTLKRSWSYGDKKDKRLGWGIYKEYLDDVLPIDKFNGNYEVEIGGFTTTAKLSLTIQLYYDHKHEGFKKYFKDLYYQELLSEEEDKKYGRKHKRQMINLGVSYDSIKNIISNDYEEKNEIIVKPTLTNDVIKGKPKMVPFEIFEYIPFNKRVPCVITVNNLFANAHFELKIRMYNYANDEIKKYLEKLKNDGETHFELKIRRLNYNFDEFKSYLINSLNSINNYQIMPVGADWNDSSHIVGYYNAITNKYQSTPANELIKRALKDPINPYFLILDEMNLSPVEKYLSDFLSAIESDEEIPLYGNDDTLKLPKNLFIIGTLNPNKNDYEFLPKILDRANIIELNSCSAWEYLSFDFIQEEHDFDIDYLQASLVNQEVVKLNIHELKEILSKISYNGNNLYDILTTEISKFYDIFKEFNFEFNFRVINEILRFMIVSWRYENSPDEWVNWKRYFDAQIKQRLLPKLFGSRDYVKNILNELFILCLDDGIDFEDIPKFKIDFNNSKYYTSALKIQKMFNSILDDNYISFMV